MSTMLEVKDLSYSYGMINAVKHISLHVDEGEIVAVIGSNGAGKTTTLRAISGLLGTPESGEVTFCGKNISHIAAHKVASMGISQCLEGRVVFPQLTVYENLQMGAYSRKDGKAEIQKTIEYCFTLFPRLKEREFQLAGTLSGGEQQMVAVARALMSKPKLLLMDEPSMGLAPLVIQDIFSIIKKINEDGVTVVLVEQNSNAALKICDRAYVLEVGEITMEGTARDLLDSDEIRKRYLGVSDEE